MREAKEDRTFEKVVVAAVSFGVILFAIGWVTRDDPAKRPLLIINGGGFVYNYRIAEVFLVSLLWSPSRYRPVHKL